MKLFKILRIAFCVLAVACAAAAVFVFIYAGWVWGLVCVLLGVVFAAGMFACKNAQVAEEKKSAPPKEHGDFITGKKDE